MSTERSLASSVAREMRIKTIMTPACVAKTDLAKYYPPRRRSESRSKAHLVGMSNCIALEISLALSSVVNITSLRTQQSHSWVFTQEKEKHISTRRSLCEC